MRSSVADYSVHAAMALPPDTGSFGSILSRLGAVADRLEQSAVLAPEIGAAKAPAPAAAAGPAGLAAAAAAAAAGVPAKAAPKAAAAPAAASSLRVFALPPPAVAQDGALAKSFDDFRKSCIPELERAGDASGIAELKQASATVATAYKMLYAGVASSALAAKPSDQAWASIFAPVMELNKAHSAASDNRSAYIQSLKAAGEAVSVVMLIAQPEPVEHFQGVLDTVDFHCTKVFQRKDPLEVDWAKALKSALTGLKKWCSDNCKSGLPWKSDGQDGDEYFAANPLGTNEGGEDGGKGKGSPLPAKLGIAKAGDSAGPGMADISKGLAGFQSGGLKKVTDDMKSKNRKDDAALVPKAKAPAAAPKAAGRPGKGPKGPPIKELQRETNWMIENQEGESNLVLGDVSVKQIVCIINCKQTTVRIEGKVKNINVDGCEKVTVVCQDVLSAVEFVNCDRTQFQTTGAVNSICIDKCDGINLYLSKASAGAEITTAKSMEMNVNVPNPDDEDDMIEIPIPEQFVTRIVGKRAQTTVSALYTH